MTGTTSASGKTVIVTGAGGVLGRGITLAFLRAGASVVISDIDLDRAKETEAVARAEGHRSTLALAGDVTVESDVQALVDQAAGHFGKLDVMVNNAGSSGAIGPLLDTTAEEFDYTIVLLLRSVFFGIKHAGRRFRAQGSGGVILSTASASAYLPGISPSLYAVCKSAVVKLTQHAARELSGEGIRVNSLSPAMVWGAGFAALGLTGDSLAAEQLVATPITAEDVGHTAVWLASDNCRQATGTDFLLDGGLLAKGSDFNERVLLPGIAHAMANAGKAGAS